LHRCSRVVNNLPAVAVPIRVDKYFASGAQQVWLLFPETRTVNVYTSPFSVRTLHEDDELTGGDLLPDFRCTVRELFEAE
jgi:Uma2 family endonuclease